MSGTDPAGTTTLRLRPDRTERLEALLLGAGPHLASLTDIGTAANGDLLLVLPAPAARLPDLLLGRPTAGEVVTVLVPLAQSLRRLHDAGVAHGGIGADAVLLDPDGSPFWAVPVAPVLLRRSGPGAFADHAAADVAAFHALCTAILGLVGLTAPVERDLAALAVALFALATPEPVRLDPSAPPPPSGPPARLLPASSAAPPAVGIRATRMRALVTFRGVRARVWVALGAVAALLVGAVVLLPSRAGAPAAPRAAAAPDPSPVPVRDTGDARSAVPALLAERDRCLAAGSESCLRRVDAAESPVLQADLAAIRAGTEPVRVDVSRLQVPAAAGGAALATAGGGTVLAVREQSGWRLRDVVAEPPPGR